MRMLGALSNGDQAARFGDYLLSRGIENQLEEGAGGWMVWVADDDKLEPARAELAAFQAQPDAPRFHAAGREANRIRAEKEKDAKRREGLEVNVRTSWFASAGRATPVTIGLIALCVLVAIFTKVGSAEYPNPAEQELLLSPPGFDPDPRHLSLVFKGEVWRLVSSMLIHFGILHLIFNMMWLADLGMLLERKRGSLWLILFILSAAAVSGVAEHYFDLGLRTKGIIAFDGYGERAGGMSGVVYALFGYAWIRGRVAPYDHIQPSDQARWIMLIWLFVCIAGFIGSVANVAHVVGLLFGMAVGRMPAVLRNPRRG
jgi:GlpG protein